MAMTEMDLDNGAQDEFFDAKTGENEDSNECNGTFKGDSTTSQSAPCNSHFFGIDFGSQRCVLADASGEIVLNELGGMTTANLVAFKGEERLIGESAVLSAATNPSNTIDFVNELLGKSIEEIGILHSFWPGERAKMVVSKANDQVACQVEYGQASHEFTPSQLAAMLFGKLRSYAAKKLSQDPAEPEQLHLLVAVPSNWNASQHDALARALHIAGIPHHTLVTREQALARCFHRKHPMEAPVEATKESEETSVAVVAPSKHIMIVDMGHLSTTAALVKLTCDGEQVISSECDQVGCLDIDWQIYSHFLKKLQLKFPKSANFSAQSRQAKRLFGSCEKLKKVLSTIPNAKVVCEHLVEESDFTMELSQQQLEVLCEDEKRKLKSLIHRVVGFDAASQDKDAAEMAAKLSAISSIEIVGGGTRMPLVQDVIMQAIAEISADAQIPIGRMLDSTTSVAVGAAFCQDLARLTAAEVIAERDALLAKELELEQHMIKKDEQLALIAHERNAIESFIYEMRAKKHQNHGDLLHSAELDKLLTDAEDWIYTEEAENATLDLLKEVNSTLQEQVRSACSEYFAAIEAENKQFESQLEKEASKAAAEAALEDGDDHDTRKLKRPERMRLLTKNKEEGNELFRGGNYQHAVMRYVKALGHASKFFDLSAQDKEEVDQIKKSLYLNLSQCYLKLENWQKAISNTQAVLDIEPTNVKALYRRAFAYERQNDLDNATKDIQEARKLAPEDKLVARLDERLKILNQRQLDKEKKMWSRAFA